MDAVDTLVSFFETLGELIEEAVDSLIGAVLSAVDWIVDSIVEVATSIVEFVEFIIDVLSGNINKFFGLGFDISKNYVYSVTGALDNGVSGIFHLEAGAQFRAQVGVTVIAKYDLFGNGFSPTFEKFLIKAGLTVDASAYFNVLVDGEVNKEVELVSKSKRKLFMIGPIQKIASK